MNKFRDRVQAGKQLADQLVNYAGAANVMVLALPRGGVPVAYEVATRLHVPLDVFVVRKLGVPGNSELAMGAIATGNVCVFNDDIIREMHITEAEMHAVKSKEQHELSRREMRYRGSHVFDSLAQKIVVLIDDGIATGATVRAAIIALRSLNPAKLVLAVPVAQKDMCHQLKHEVDDFICLLQPEVLHAVGSWYDNFSQTEDSEVSALLASARI